MLDGYAEHYPTPAFSRGQRVEVDCGPHIGEYGKIIGVQRDTGRYAVQMESCEDTLVFGEFWLRAAR